MIASNRRVSLALALAALFTAAGENTARAGDGRPVGDGVAFLRADRNPSGSWGSAYEFVDTCTAVESLATLDAADPDAAAGALFLDASAAPNHDWLAREAAALARVEGFAALALTLAEDLLALRNPPEPNGALPNWPEGGWGVAPGFGTDCMTTALALAAIDAAGLRGGFTATNQTLAASQTRVHEWDIPADATKARILITVTGSTVRLRMKRGSPPGGADPFFSLPPGTFLVVFPDSGIALQTGHNFISVQSAGAAAGYSLTASYETPRIDTRSLAEAADYLKKSINPDGGFGLQRGQASDFWTTLHVLPVLARYGAYEFTAEIAAARAYLVARQLGDGSFGFGVTGVPYATALGVLALARTEAFPSSAPTLAAVAALLAQQEPDGSWAGEPYDTALAVLALHDQNRPPSAGAGTDRTVTDTDLDGFETVTLSATASDPDGTVDSIEWFEDGAPIASGAAPAVVFAVGVHVVDLVVTDDRCRQSTDSLVVDVRAGSPGVCPPVTGLTCRSLFPDIALSWTNGAAYDSIEIRLFGEEVATLAGSATTFTDPGLPIGDYAYSVVGVCADGGISTAASCSVFHAPPCDPVRAIRGRLASGVVRLFWTNGDDYSEVEILRDGVVVATLPGTATSFEAPSLGARPVYGVRGVCNGRTPSIVIEWFPFTRR